MRCKKCDYPLWNLRTGQCPECGAPFKPSEYEFSPGSVRFGCPHCENDHPGTSETGHPEPPQFDCAGCGRTVHVDQMSVRPTRGADETHLLGSMPWLRRRTRGLFKGFFGTVGWALAHPVRLINAVPKNSPVGEALVFALLIALLATFGGGCLSWTMIGIGGSVFFRGAGVFLPFAPGLFGAGQLVLITMGWMLGLLVLWPVLTHAMLRLTGGCRYSIDRTIQAVSYSAGANLLAAVPCLGPYLGGIWWMVSAILMVKAGQRVSGWRATLAVLALPVLLALGGGALFGIAVSMMTAAGFLGGPGGGWNAQTAQTWMMTNNIISASWSTNGTGPAHVIEMMPGTSAMTGAWGGAATPGGQPFCHPGTKTTPADIPVGDMNLKDFLAAPSSAQFKAAAQVLDDLPANLVAHRFGDFVFTYHGAAVNSVDAQLWTVVMLPDPTVNGSPAAGDPVHIGANDYTVSEITFGELAEALKQQNIYRATIGLPPLPDLTTVTHDKPAVAPPKKE